MHVLSTTSGRLIAALATLGLVFAGCSSGGGASVPTPDPASPSAVAPSADHGGSETPAAASPAASLGGGDTGPAAVPSASAAVIVDLGVVGITPFGNRVTVHSFGPSDRSPEPPAGSAWLEADVEWCLPPTFTRDISVGQVRYQLVLELSDATTIEPDADADSPDEIYASDGRFSANECVRGALVFAVPTGATPEYLLEVSDGGGGTRWALA